MTLTTLNIGGFSEGHLLTQAQKVVDRKSKETSIFDLEAESRIPTFLSDELSIGKVLGRGGFCRVSEITKITLKSGNSGSELVGANSHVSRDASSRAGAVLQDREFMQSFYLRNGKDYRYAIKMLKEDATGDVQTFINGVVDLAVEARFLSVIRHPNIIKMRAHSSGTPFSRDFFIVLDRLNDILSKTLVTWSKRKVVGVKKLFDLSGKKTSTFLIERITVARDIANALTYLHSLKVVYRDLKPDNIGFDVRGDVKLFDFGLARELPNHKLSNGMYKMTADTGSPRYMAPEIALEQPYNEKVDVYSFAILLHQICSLETPFAGYSKKMFDKLVVKDGYRPKCDPNWPQELQSLLQNCWSPNISQRLSINEVMESLSAIIEKETGRSMGRSLTVDVSEKTQRSIRRMKGV